MNTKRWVALAIFIVLLGGSIISSFVQDEGSSTSFSMGEEWSEDVYKQGGLQKIALLEVEGTIVNQPSTQGFFQNTGYDHKAFLQQLEHAFKDNQVKGIVLKVNSPGGGVVESDEIYHKIRQLKEKYPKPIVTSMANVAASGGYYIAAPTDKIFANRSTITGSIGVIIQSFNVKELADEWGVKPQTFTSGPHKDILSPFKEMSKEERQIVQNLTDEMYANFVDVIVEGRGMDRNKVLALADGRIYSGQQAEKNGLVDEIGFLDDAINETAKMGKVENPTVVSYKRNGFAAFNSMFGSLKSFSNSNVLGMREMISGQNPPSLMYLFTW
jgi:protease-4